MKSSREGSAWRVAIIGGGAAGFFAAIRCAEVYPEATVTIYEKTSKLLTKVRISGGGRCNVTNGADYASQVLKGYPRGRSLLKKLFKRFDHKDAQEWFSARGVRLKTESDGRVFPVSDNSEEIIRVLMSEVDRLGISIRLRSPVQSIEKGEEGLKLQINAESMLHTHVIVTTGGANKLSAYKWLADLGHKIQNPVPSLFTFNMPSERIKNECQGIVVQDTRCRVEGIKGESDGPVLITHWGMSGPAILKLSSWAARQLADLGYRFRVRICWLPDTTESELIDRFASSQKQMGNLGFRQIPNRLYLHLLSRAEVDPRRQWKELKKSAQHKLLTALLHDLYEVEGKTTFKEEFVTCGGVDLASVELKTLESKHVDGLYFAGEVLDIDAITGGYNFQAAWTTAWVAGGLGA